MESTNNKLIAEFMGYKVFSKGTKCYSPKYDEGLEPMKFHKSWDWLMPVAEKCLTTGDRQHFVINDALLTCNIEEVYNAVVEFIKQYNDEKQ